MIVESVPICLESACGPMTSALTLSASRPMTSDIPDSSTDSGPGLSYDYVRTYSR